MAHRGRLNVLANILHKPYGLIFREFEDNLPPRRSAATATSSTTCGFSVGPRGTGQAARSTCR